MASTSASVSLTAEEAQRKMVYIQAELLRVQRACEYRDEHPYDRSETGSRMESGGTTGKESHSGGTTPHTGRRETSTPSIKPVRSFAGSHAASTTPSSCGAGDAFHISQASPNKSSAASGRGRAGSTTRTTLSFSQFERRRIAQLLGRVAVEIAAVWAYVQQCSSMTEGAAPGSCCDAATATPYSTPMHTAREPARQSSERSVATATPASEQNFTQQPPPSSQLHQHGLHDGSGSGTGTNVSGGGGGAAVHTRGAAEGIERETTNSVSPAVQMAALNTLIQTAMAIQQMLGGAGGEGSANTSGDEGQRPLAMDNSPPLGVRPCAFAPGVAAAAESALFSGSATMKEDNSTTAPLLPSPDLDHTLPASASEPSLPPPSPSPPPQQQQTQRVASPEHHVSLSNLSATQAPSAALPGAAHGSVGGPKVSIPAYLKAYVLEGSERNTADGEEGSIEDDDDATVVVVNVDRGDSRSVSAGSTTGVNLRSHSRLSDVAALSHGGSHNASPPSAPHEAEVPLGGRGRVPGVAAAASQGNASNIIAHHRLDSDMSFTTPSSPFKRVLSGSSLRSSSLIGSPVQALQHGRTRSHGYSTGSLYSQPLNVANTSTNNNNTNANSSSAGRSPDSAEMSPAAAAAYSRSTSLLRRPHRLEVPISRTHSLRRVPSCTSPTSLASGTPPSGAAVAVGGSSGSAFSSHAPSPSLHVVKSGGTPSQPSVGGSGSGSGVGGASAAVGPAPSSSAPLGVAVGGAADSPHSSAAGLHFKRVISVDSENGGWPPGSLADSLEMSQSRTALLFGRPMAPSHSLHVASSSPLPQEMGGGAAELTMLSSYPPASGTDAAGGASAASSALAGLYVVPGRSDSLRGASVHSRNLTPSYFSSPTGSHARTPAPPPPFNRAGASLSSSMKNARPSPVMQSQPLRAVTTTTNPAAVFAKSAEHAPLPPNSYKIDADKLTAFLQCVKDLVQVQFSEEEFDSMRLFYFLPGVSLRRPAGEANGTGQATELGGGSPSRPASTTSSALGVAVEEAPLPLFSGGERVSVRLTKLDVFYSLVWRKVQEVCENVGIPSESYLSLL